MSEFAFRWERSRFLECQVPAADIKNSKSIPYKYAGAMAATQSLMVEHGAAPFLMYGTLLGWRRHCGFIPHTNDVDMGVRYEQTSPGLLKALRDFS